MQRPLHKVAHRNNSWHCCIDVLAISLRGCTGPRWRKKSTQFRLKVSRIHVAASRLQYGSHDVLLYGRPTRCTGTIFTTSRICAVFTLIFALFYEKFGNVTATWSISWHAELKSETVEIKLFKLNTFKYVGRGSTGRELPHKWK